MLMAKADDVFAKTKRLIGVVFWQPLAQRGPSRKERSFLFGNRRTQPALALKVPAGISFERAKASAFTHSMSVVSAYPSFRISVT